MHLHSHYPRQPVGWGTLHEAPPLVVAPYVEARPADWLLLAILRPAWAYRLELALLTVLAVAYVWLGGKLGREDADRLIVAAAFVVAVFGLDPRSAGQRPGPLPCPAAVGAGLPPCRAGVSQ
jgi:hypothetical protein